jgi:hypothetical protein
VYDSRRRVLGFCAMHAINVENEGLVYQGRCNARHPCECTKKEGSA